MTKLSKVLKDIYTSDNKVTVLQLLDKLIKAVEAYEVEKIIEEGPVYTHFVTLSCSNGLINVTLTTTYDQELTLDNIKTLMLNNTNSIPCSGSYNASGDAYCPAINLRISGTTGNIVVRYIDTSDGNVVTDTHDLVVNTFTDRVINIKEVLS